MIGTQLQWNANRNSYVLYRMALFSLTLSDAAFCQNSLTTLTTCSFTLWCTFRVDFGPLVGLFYLFTVFFIPKSLRCADDHSIDSRVRTVDSMIRTYAEDSFSRLAAQRSRSIHLPSTVITAGYVCNWIRREVNRIDRISPRGTSASSEDSITICRYELAVTLSCRRLSFVISTSPLHLTDLRLFHIELRIACHFFVFLNFSPFVICISIFHSSINQSINQSVNNFTDERVKTTTDIVTKNKHKLRYNKIDTTIKTTMYSAKIYRN